MTTQASNRSDPRELESQPMTRDGIRSNLGLQLFTVRSALQRDFIDTLRTIAEIGYSEVEMFGLGGTLFVPDPWFGMSPGELKGFLAELGLCVPSAQISGAAKNVQEIADMALEVGAQHLVLGMAPTFLSVPPGSAIVSAARDIDQMLTLAHDLNAIGALCRKSGIGFAYHNHHMEFARFGDQGGFEILLANTDPSLVSMELDVGWAAVAAVDGTDYLERYPERFMACHFKDFDPSRPIATVSRETPIPEMTQLIPPGEGNLDFSRLLSVMDRVGIRHGYVEVDIADDPIEASKSAFQYLSAVP